MAPPLIIAHRGASGYAPENTLAAFRMALDAGAEGLEFDVQLSSDGVPVVIHDETLVRTARRPEGVADLTARQLQKIDVGSWFNAKYRKRAQPQFSRETIPTLELVLTSLGDFTGLIYVELKCNEGNFRQLARAVADLVSGHPLGPQVIVKSFKLAAISEVRHLAPEITIAALFAPEIMHYLRRREHIISLAREFGADQLSIHFSLATRRVCALAADAGMLLTVWTVDDPAWLSRRRSYPIRALITNDPEKFLRLRSLAGLS